MIRIMNYVLAVIVFFATTSAAAPYVYLSNDGGPHSPGMSINPTAGDPSASLVEVGPCGSPWKIVQWGNPKPLDKTAAPDQCGGWTIANTTTHVGWTPRGDGSYSATLSQNGNAGDAPLVCGAEYDLFLSDELGTNHFINSPTFDRLDSITLSFNLQYSYRAITRRCGSVSVPWYDQASPTVGLILQSRGLPKGQRQTNFYQLILNTSLPGQEICSFPRYYYYDGSTGPFGVNESLADYGVPCPVPGEAVARHYKLDVLPHFVAAIQAGPPALNKDISKWMLVGFYVGNIGYGGFGMTTEWSKISIIGDVR